MKAQEYDPTKEQTGCIYNMPNEAYHGHKAISNTELYGFRQRPDVWHGRYTGEIEDEDKDCYVQGAAIHAAILEPPEVFQEEFAVVPENLAFRGKADKSESIAALSEVLAVNPSGEEKEMLLGFKKDEILSYFRSFTKKRLLFKPQMDLVKIARERFAEHEVASELLEGGVGEVSFRSPKLKLGYQVQCRFDKINMEGCERTDGRSFGIDIKTIERMDTWDRDFWKRGYYRAWPFYAKAQEAAVGERIVKNWFWVVIEKQKPYKIRVRAASPECWERGMAEISKDMKAMSEALKHGIKDPEDTKIHMQPLPDFMLESNVPEPGLRVYDEWIPQRDYESDHGWSEEKGES